MVHRRGYRYRLNFLSPPPCTMDVFSWECCHQCVRLPKLPRTDIWIISHHFWHYFGRATVPRKRPFCDPPGQSICSRPTLDFSWNRRGHIGLGGPTSPVEYKYWAIAKSTAQSRRFVNSPIFENQPGPQTSSQGAETRTVVRHRRELSVGEISELHRVLVGRYAANKVAKNSVFS